MNILFVPIAYDKSYDSTQFCQIRNESIIWHAYIIFSQKIKQRMPLNCTYIQGLGFFVNPVESVYF